MPDLEFPTGAGTAPGYLAVPAGEHGPATIVLQEWWGLDSHIRSVCDRLADEGFFALAPDLFRGETTTQPSEAEQKLMALSMDQAEQDMCGAAGLPGLACRAWRDPALELSASAWAADWRCGPPQRAPRSRRRSPTTT